jgi:hypothetical protein
MQQAVGAKATRGAPPAADAQCSTDHVKEREDDE